MIVKKYFGRKARFRILICLCCALSMVAATSLQGLPALASAAGSGGTLGQRTLDPAWSGEATESNPVPESAQEPVPPLDQPPAPDQGEAEIPEAPESPAPDMQEEAEIAPSPLPEPTPPEAVPDAGTPEETTGEENTEEPVEGESPASPTPEGDAGEDDESALQTPPPPEEEATALPEHTPEAEVPLEYPEIILELDLTEIPILTAGGQFDIPLALLITLGEQVFATHGGALDGSPLAYDPQAPAAAYDQALTQYLQELTLFLPGQTPEDLPLDWAASTLEGDLVQAGENRGYALLRLAVAAEAVPGTYTLPLWVRYTPAGSDVAQEVTLHLALRVEEPSVASFAFTMVPGRTDAVIVTSHAELRAALKTNLYSTIYLGYTEENQGVIAYADAAGLPIARDMVIDGTDPLSGHRMRLVDYPGSGPLEGLYASASGLTITVQNIDITGYNYYGVMYGTGSSGIALHFRNVNYQGRQMAHNVGANALVTFTDCVVEIANMSTGTSHEMLEAPSVTFYGSNEVTRTGPETNSLFYIYGTGDKTLTIASGASVRLRTTDYMIFTDNSAKMSLQVYGDLHLTTTGSRGSATYLDLYLGEVAIHSAGSLTIDHQNAQRPTLRVLNLQVQGSLRLTRQGSTLPVLGIESGGSAVFENPRTVVLQNPSGALIRSVAGSPKMTVTTQVINRYRSGGLDSVWNNVDLSPFTTQWTLAIGGGSLTGVSGLEAGGRGVAIGAAILSDAPPALMSDTALHFGRTTLSLNQVGAGDRNVTGAAVSGASVEVREYAYDESQGLGSLLQSRATKAGGGVFTLAGDPLDSPITFPGSRVYAIGDDGTLVAHTYTDPVVTGPVFLEVPESLPFETTRLSARDQLIPRVQEDWRLVVYDPRQSGEGFKLYAQLTSPFRAAGDTLAHGLVLATGQTVTALGEEPLLLASGDTGDGLDTYAVSWAADQGLLAHLSAFAGVPGVPYEASVTFTLLQGP